MKTNRIIPLILTLTVIVLLSSGGSTLMGANEPSDESSESSRPLTSYEMGMKDVRQSQFRDAVKHFQKAVETDSQNADAYNMLAFSQRKNGKLREAIRNYHRALEIRPRFPQAREYLGETYLKAALEQLHTLKRSGPEARKEYEELLSVLKKSTRSETVTEHYKEY